jgi:hypothetical protein
MKTANFLTSSCRHCRYYQAQGRRGGMCQQLGVPVHSHWKACVFAVHPFTSTWENLEALVHLEHSLALNCTDERATVGATTTPQLEVKGSIRF